MQNNQKRRLPSQIRHNYEPPDGYWAVGLIVGVHGLHGEVKVELYTDFPERFEPGSYLLLGDQLRKLQIESVRPHKTHLLIKFAQVEGRESADLLRNQWLLIHEGDAVNLEADAFWIHEILGLKVKTVEGENLGEVIDVLQTGANDVYLVALDPPRGTQKELLIPAIADVVKAVDLEQATITIALLPGMIES